MSGHLNLLGKINQELKTLKKEIKWQKILKYQKLYQTTKRK